MKILVAGDGHSQLHERPAVNALRSLGHETRSFFWHEYFRATTDGGLRALWRRAQDKFVRGPTIARLNADFVRTTLSFRPDLVFVYRGTHITAASLRQIRSMLPTVCIAGYNNDDPLGPGQPGYRWRNFFACLPEYDLVLAYRQHNMDDFRQRGARRTYLLRSWFVPELNHPVPLSDADRESFGADVVFVGHYEPDGRLEFLESLAQDGVRLRIFGHSDAWNPVLSRSSKLRHLVPVGPVWGDDYNKALAGARIALCFFSRLNRDTYTRRCFEIPAVGTLLLSEYSDDLASLFREGIEADFFRTREELVNKVRLYLKDPARCAAVARAGNARVIADRHDVRSRFQDLLDWMTQSGMLGAARC